MATASGLPRSFFIFAFLLVVLLAFALPIFNAARIASSRDLLQEGPVSAPTSSPTSTPPSATAAPSPDQSPVSASTNAPTIDVPAFSPQQGPVLPALMPSPSNPTPAEGHVSVPVAGTTSAPVSNAPANAPEQGPSAFVCPQMPMVRRHCAHHYADISERRLCHGQYQQRVGGELLEPLIGPLGQKSCQ
jgi:cytoskeletal protein RodZ